MHFVTLLLDPKNVGLAEQPFCSEMFKKNWLLPIYLLGISILSILECVMLVLIFSSEKHSAYFIVKKIFKIYNFHFLSYVQI